MRASILLLALAVLAASPASAQEPVAFEEVRRFAAAEAIQGVAVDDDHFYAIANRSIGKYEKATGRRVAGWEGPADGPIIHLDSGVILDGLLYCAHSNYPGVPMLSSIEIFDPETMTHVGSRSLGIMPGSATWIDRSDGHWWVAFGNYAGAGGVPGRGPEWTTLLQFDGSWRRVAGYTYPPEVVESFADMSNSGGTWGTDGSSTSPGTTSRWSSCCRYRRPARCSGSSGSCRSPRRGRGSPGTAGSRGRSTRSSGAAGRSWSQGCADHVSAFACPAGTSPTARA